MKPISFKYFINLFTSMYFLYYFNKELFEYKCIGAVHIECVFGVHCTVFPLFLCAYYIDGSYCTVVLESCNERWRVWLPLLTGLLIDCVNYCSTTC